MPANPDTEIKNLILTKVREEQLIREEDIPALEALINSNSIRQEDILLLLENKIQQDTATGGSNE